MYVHFHSRLYVRIHFSFLVFHASKMLVQFDNGFIKVFTVALLGSFRYLIYKICSRHDIAEILLKFALNSNQSIHPSLPSPSLHPSLLLLFLMWRIVSLLNKSVNIAGFLHRCNAYINVYGTV